MSKRGTLIVIGLLVAGCIGYWVLSGSNERWSGSPDGIRDPARSSKRGKRAKRRAAVPAAAHGLVRQAGTSSPVAGAVVQFVPTKAQPALGTADLVARTDDKGRWQLGAIPPGEYSMAVTAPGFLPKVTPQLELRPGADEALNTNLDTGGNLLSGTVSDLTGGTIESALIRLTPIIGVLQPRRTRGFASMSRDGGKYKLHVPDGRYRVICSHEAYVTSSRVIEIRGNRRSVDFALSPGGVIEGRVLSAVSGVPIAGAIINYSRDAVRTLPGLGAIRGLGQRGVVKAGKDGRFRVRGLAAGAIKLRAHAPGTASRDAITVPLAIAERVTSVELFLVDAYSISGVVMVNLGAEPPTTPKVPAAGVWVTARRRGGAPLRSVAKTGADGRFEIDGALPDRYTLRVHGGAYVAPDVGAPVTVKHTNLTGVELKVNQGAMITGRVDPATTAEVGIQIGDPSGTSKGKHTGFGIGRMLESLRLRSSVQTDADGKFKIGPVRPGSLTLVAKAADGKKGKLRLEVPAGGANNLVIQLEDKASVSGKVVDEDGKPVTNATVSLKRVHKGRRMTMIVNGRDITADQSPTHEDGSFKIVGLDAGNYELSVRDRGGNRLAWARPKHEKQPTQPLAYTVEARRNHTGVSLRVEARNHVIKGVALGPDGKPARDVWVNASMATKEMRFGGGLPAVQPKHPPPESGKTRRTVSVMTMVMDSDEGDHGGGGMGMGSAIAPVLTNEDGEFEIKNLRKGEYNLMGEGLRGSARGFLTGVKTGSTATIKLVALTRVRGVVTQDGKPVSSFKVELTGAGRRSKWVRDPDGKFVLYRVDPGKYTVEVTGAAGSGKAQITVEAGKTSEVNLNLDTLVRVTGKLVDPNGNPVANAKLLTGSASGGRVKIEIADGEAPTMTRVDGSFELRLGKGGKVLLVMGEDKPGPRIMHRFEIKSSADLDLGELKTRW